jgi:hypothetical protein
MYAPGGGQQLRLEVRYVRVQRAHSHLLIDFNAAANKRFVNHCPAALLVDQVHDGLRDVLLDRVEDDRLVVAQAGVLEGGELVIFDVVAIL